MMMGSHINNQLKVTNYITRYDGFKARKGETLTETYERFNMLLNNLQINKITKTNTENNIKFMNNLQPEWKSFVSHIRHTQTLEKLLLHELYEMLLQDEEEVFELMGNRASGKEPVKSGSKPEDHNSDSDPEYTQIKEAMLFLTQAFQKRKFFNKSSNKQRYSTTPLNHRDNKEKYEGKRHVEEGKKTEKRREEKAKEEPIKCYNCGRLGNFAKDCRKPVVRNSDYYKAKMLLAKEKEAGKALMAEDDYRLNVSDEEEVDEEAHLCFMGKHSAQSDSDDDDDRNSPCQSECIENQSIEIVGNLCIISNLKEECESCSKESKELKTKVDDLTYELRMSENEKIDIVTQSVAYKNENQRLSNQLKDLEQKLYKIGQSHQTLNLIAPKEPKYADTGIGYDNPFYLKNALSEVPTLYAFKFLGIDKTYLEYKINWTKPLDDEEMEEDNLQRKNSTKMQLPFVYDSLNASYNDEKPCFLSNDYFRSYTQAELEAKTVKTEEEPLDHKLNSQLAALAADRVKERFHKAEPQAKPTILQVEKISLSENSYPPSDTSSCKSFMGDSSPTLSNKGKEPHPDHCSDFQTASAFDPLKETNPSNVLSSSSDKAPSDEELEFSAFLNSEILLVDAKKSNMRG
ncbi:hypothetical protein L6452_18206 [Arctium lappa]|uniref:Uncharacterized protein n=1 Tax=Arctium lappa TaxID=4217 RepID=A0ACB9C5S1_ARCLA|nr:hypothetical protein L6452_18206 [Arctium lappa]